MLLLDLIIKRFFNRVGFFLIYRAAPKDYIVMSNLLNQSKKKNLIPTKMR